jgi:hypothetical protein
MMLVKKIALPLLFCAIPLASSIATAEPTSNSLTTARKPVLLYLTQLQDFDALLVPAPRVLAYGYFKNFLKPAYESLQGGKVDLPDYKLPNVDNEGNEGGENAVMTLSFSTFRIRIAKPVSWEDATDAAVVNLRKNRLAEISIKQPGSRRAFRVYVPTETKQLLDNAMRDNLKRAKKAEALLLNVEVDRLDVVDFPTPLIALHDFVESEMSGETSAESWQKQKTLQYNEFFRYLESLLQKAGIKYPFLSYFNYNNSPDFKLPD